MAIPHHDGHDRNLRDIDGKSLQIWGAVILIAADLCQTLPVIPRSTQMNEWIETAIPLFLEWQMQMAKCTVSGGSLYKQQREDLAHLSLCGTVK